MLFRRSVMRATKDVYHDRYDLLFPFKPGHYLFSEAFEEL